MQQSAKYTILKNGYNSTHYLTFLIFCTVYKNIKLRVYHQIFLVLILSLSIKKGNMQ